MKIIKGDLIKLALQGHFDIIIHGCNCFNTMGSGIAKQIKNTFPKAFVADSLTKKGDKNKLGTYSVVNLNNISPVKVIINAYIQYNYGRDKCYVDYDAIRKCFKSINKEYSDFNYRFGYPKIGAGLAGGDWNIISKIIDEEFKNRDHTLIEYNKNKI